MKIRRIVPVNFNKINEWLKIDAELQKKLKELEALNQERNFLITKAENQKVLTSEVQKSMEISLAKYQQLSSEVAMLKEQAKLIANQSWS